MRHRSWVKIAFVYSEDKVDIPEDVQHLCDKCKPYAEAWTKTADKLWEERQAAKK